MSQLLDALQAGKQLDLAHAEIRTAGDLWKALHEGRTPAVKVSAVSIGPPYGPNIVRPEFPKPADQLKWGVLERALAGCDAEGGNPAEAMRKLIARVALAKGVDRREIINMPLAGFLEAAAPRDGTPRVSKEEANLRARDALRARPPKGQRWTVRKLATAIGCSAGLAAGLPTWRAYAEEHGLTGQKSALPKVVSLTDGVLANEGTNDEQLERLICELQAGLEESPLVSHARKHPRRFRKL